MALIFTIHKESNGLADADFQPCSAGGDYIPNDGSVVAWMRNWGGAAINITFVGAQRDSFGFLNPRVETVEAGSVLKGLLMDVDRFNDLNRRVQVTYSINPPTGFSIACVRQEAYVG